MTISLPDGVRGALDRLEGAGYPAYVVGGAVRDALRGAAPHDFDICTAATPDEMHAVFADCRTVDTGLKHGTITLVTGDGPVEITTFRVETGYSDRRHPDGVRFVRDVEADLARRDFTINAMAWSPVHGLADPFGGQADLGRGVLRAVGDPARRFAEDALRILRGLRMAAELGFFIEDETAQALRAAAETLREIAAERIAAETLRLLCGRYAGQVLRAYTEVLAVVLPELAPMRGFDQRNRHHLYDVLEHSIRALEQAPAVPLLRLAALYHDAGKPGCATVDEQGVGHFYGHPKLSAALAEQRFLALRLPTALREQAVFLIRQHDVPIDEDVRIVRRRLAQYGEERLRALLALKKADCVGQGTHPEYIGHYQRLEALLNTVVRDNACLHVRDLALGGRELMALGLRGPAIGEMQRWLLEQVLDDPARNETQTLTALARAHMEETR